MSERSQPEGGAPPSAPSEPGLRRGFLPRYLDLQRTHGLLAPLITALIAFAMGGVVIVISTGKAPWGVYREIFQGAGLDWVFTFDQTAGENLQQTLIITGTLMLTGLAVAFAFRCGLFNIGGQGQYLAGSIIAVIVGSNLQGLNPLVHIVLVLVLGTLTGAAIAGIAGLLKATVGAHEVISTIMLNWIVIWVGVFLFTVTGPLQNVASGSPISHDIADAIRLTEYWVWGDKDLQGLHLGIFIALAALFVYWIILNRTTLGYEVKAVGFNPEAARYGGIDAPRNYFLAMAISGAFAGLAGAVDILGWQFRLSTGDIQVSYVGFVGIAVALLGRNTAIGVGLAALLFGSLLTGTSTRNLDPEVFQPELASNLTVLIQGLIVLFVGADVIVLFLLSKLRRRPA